MLSSNVLTNPRLNAILSAFVSVHSHEVSALLHSSSCFFFVIVLDLLHALVLIRHFDWNFSLNFTAFVYQILSAYFVVLPLRDEGAISLGLSNLPGLFVGSLVLTLIAAPLSTLAFSLPNYSKAKVLA